MIQPQTAYNFQKRFSGRSFCCMSVNPQIHKKHLTISSRFSIYYTQNFALLQGREKNPLWFLPEWKKCYILQLRIPYFSKSATRCRPIFAAEAARTPRFRPSLRYPKHRAHQAAGRSQGFFCRYEYRLCRSEAEGNKAARTVPAFRFCAEAACRVIRLLCFRSRLLEPKTPASKMSWRRSSLSAAGIRSGFGTARLSRPKYRMPRSSIFQVRQARDSVSNSVQRLLQSRFACCFPANKQISHSWRIPTPPVRKCL